MLYLGREERLDYISVSGRGERPVEGRDAELRALISRVHWPNADSGGTGTDSGYFRMRPGCVRILPDASGF